MEVRTVKTGGPASSSCVVRKNKAHPRVEPAARVNAVNGHQS